MPTHCTYRWYNQTLCKVNTLVRSNRLGVVEDVMPFNQHGEDDEFFCVVEEFLIDLLTL